MYYLKPGSPAAGYGCQTFSKNGKGGARNEGSTPSCESSPRSGTERRDEIEVSGPITVDTVWSADTVKVIGDVTVVDGVTLTIEPGVLVEFQDFYRLSILGRLIAVGTPADRIVFTTDEPHLFVVDRSLTGCWNGIRFLDTLETNGESRLEQCIIEYGKAIGGGSGLYPYGGGAISIYNFSRLVVASCIVRSNVADYGGGFFLYQNACPRIIGNLIVDNHALENASVAYCGYSYPSFVNNTMVNNTIHNSQNPYIESGAVVSMMGKPLFLNNIVYGNDPEFVYSHVQLWENKEYYTRCNDIEGYADGGLNIDADPLFLSFPGPPVDYRLRSRSPCINRGDNDGAWLVDLDGNPRPTMGAVEMGAYEFTEVHLLESDLFSVPASGGTIHFTLDGGAQSAGRGYYMLGSTSGTVPGTPLPGSAARVPLNVDPLTNRIIGFYGTPFFEDFTGMLDQSGTAAATMNMPPQPGAAGMTMSFVSLLIQPIDLVSNPLSIAIVP